MADEVGRPNKLLETAVMVLIADEGVPILVRETREEIVRNKSQDVADETLVLGEVAPEHGIVDPAVGVVGDVSSEQNEVQ